MTEPSDTLRRATAALAEILELRGNLPPQLRQHLRQTHQALASTDTTADDLEQRLTQLEDELDDLRQSIEAVGQRPAAAAQPTVPEPDA